MKLKLVDDWRIVYKYASFQLGVLGTLVTSLLIAFPDNAYFIWQQLPQDVRGFIPEKYMPMIGVFIFVLSKIAQYVKQRKIQNEKLKQVIGPKPDSRGPC